ncbi:pyridoxal 5'-phosphate synthase glutaminase subunit PdxT [Anaeromicropila herbilytica]|uniref:Pyridoxal 5'-phosphate synthase subunit PdxT n=1 Tax=Anaeromicropila herbilytica TaxID=2785025 RepID=A0A7R7IDT5_9FIRM|nr:pyridoxal 5'-phosphate synthase glutaminase subunit PdxT [Anaeromicropila herbilytica]BCN31296.1 pyridoxal 5'-phosphate synthase glutaminase subunit PdxT [Anaeromicropila herbilytica]
MVVAILALQGAFIEHEQTLHNMGIETIQIRKKTDLDTPFDGLILPGGESTVMGKLLKELDLFDIIKNKIEDGLPVFGTCAGLILLASHIVDDNTVHFGTLPATVVRNAYGRQLGSFYTEGNVEGLGQIPMKFIRAPYVKSVDDHTKVLSIVDEKIVAIQYKNQLGVAFHPELTDNHQIHQYFIDIINQYTVA